MVSALNAIQQYKKYFLDKDEQKTKEKTEHNNEQKNEPEEKIIFSPNTVIGSLAKYISTPNSKFQPMNANFGILPELEGKKIKDKKERYKALAERSLKGF